MFRLLKFLVKSLFKLILATIFVIAAVVVWQQWQNQQRRSQWPPQQAPPASLPPYSQAPAPPAPSVADLVIVGARGRRQQGQHLVEVTVENRGPSLASGVDGVCSYRCVSRGTSVNNQSFLQGGYLTPGRSIVGLLPVAPCPDRSLELQCFVDPGNAIPETNEGNNQWIGLAPMQ